MDRIPVSGPSITAKEIANVTGAVTNAWYGNANVWHERFAKKREIFIWYAEELGAVAGVTLNSEAPGTKNTYWMVTVVLDDRFGLKKRRLMELMAAQGIDCRPFFHPLSSLPAYAHSSQAALARQRNAVSYRSSPFAVNLPSALYLSRPHVARVCQAVREILAGK